MIVFITGGAGYVGSHVVKELRALGVPCIVLDNLIRGHRELVLDAELVVGDVGNSALVRNVLDKYHVDAVMHFAACAYFRESMGDPARY